MAQLANGNEVVTPTKADEALAKVSGEKLAAHLGRKGGLKGGKARMSTLTHEQRRQLGLKGARARWGKKR